MTASNVTAAADARVLPAAALILIADVAAQSPLVAQWLAGWLSAKDRDGQHRLVIEAARLEPVE